MALARATRFNNQNWGFLLQIAPRGQIMHERTIQMRQPIKIKLLNRLGRTKLRPTQTCAELLLFASCDLVANKQRQKLCIGQLGLNGLAVARRQ
jgi:hypothetical protein